LFLFAPEVLLREPQPLPWAGVLTKQNADAKDDDLKAPI
jgi:hypothetical protein